jgi:hypothetical protein
MKNKNLFDVCLVIISIIILIVILWFFLFFDPTPRMKLKPGEKIRSIEGFVKVRPFELTIHNFLKNHSINLIYVPCNSSISSYKLNKDPIKSDSQVTIPLSLTLKKHDKIKIISDSNKGPESFFDDYKIIDENINSLYVGMITGHNAPNSDVYKPAFHDMMQIRIHNLGTVPLTFNNSIYVEPKEMVIYEGREKNGIPLGLVLKNNDNIYPQFKITTYTTDIYYGLVAQYEQPVKGGIRYSFPPGVLE